MSLGFAARKGVAHKGACLDEWHQFKGHIRRDVRALFIGRPFGQTTIRRDATGSTARTCSNIKRPSLTEKCTTSGQGHVQSVEELGKRMVSRMRRR